MFPHGSRNVSNDPATPGLSRREWIASGASLLAIGSTAAVATPQEAGPRPGRVVHPAVEMHEVWPGPEGYPWAGTGVKLWTREGILRRVGPQRLLCTWTTGGFSEPTDGNFTMGIASDDLGRTWSKPSVLFRHARRGLFTTELFVPEPGVVHAFLQTYALGTWITQIHSYRATSRDGGQTWSGPHSIPGGIHNVWVNQGLVHSSGRWVIPVSWAEHVGDEWCEPSVGRPPVQPVAGARPIDPVELPWGSDDPLVYRAGNDWAHRNHRYAVGAILSDDRGESFRLRGYLKREEPRHFFEPKVVERSDGSIALLTRELNDGWLWQSHSTDRGETWGDLERTEIPNPSSKVKLLRARDGRIVLIHNPSPPVPSAPGEPFRMGRRSPLSIWISRDDMRTWAVKVDLVTDPAGSLNYPDGYIDDEAGVVHFAWEDGQRVYVAKVPLDIR